MVRRLRRQLCPVTVDGERIDVPRARSENWLLAFFVSFNTREVPVALSLCDRAVRDH